MKSTYKVFFFILLFSFSNIMAIDHAIKVKLESLVYSDETVIRFLPNATNSYDNGSDAQKLFSQNQQVPAIFTKCDSTTNLAINALPMYAGQVRVPLLLKIPAAGTYNLRSIILGAFQNGTGIFLYDRQTGNYFDFSHGNLYVFNLTPQSINSPARFELCFTSPGVVSTTGTSCSFLTDGSVTISKANLPNWELIIRDSSHVIISQVDSLNTPYTMSGLVGGNYTYETYSSSAGIQTGSFTISSAAPLAASFIFQLSHSGNGAVVAFNNTSTNAVDFNWSFGDGSSSTLEHPTHHYLTDSIYHVELTVSNLNCTTTYSSTLDTKPIVLAGHNEEQTSQVNIFTNDGGLVITRNQDEETHGEVIVYDMHGRLLFNDTIIEATFNVSKEKLRSTSTYLVVVTSNGQVVRKKLVLLVS